MSQDKIKPADAGDSLLDLEAFLACVAAISNVSSATLTGETALEDVWRGDQFHQFTFTLWFDELTKGFATPDEGIFDCVTVRDLYWHYLYISSRPIGIQ